MCEGGGDGAKGLAMAKQEHIWWAWQDPNGELDLENLRPTRGRCLNYSDPWGDRKGKPVRVRSSNLLLQTAGERPCLCASFLMGTHESGTRS
jgi:hypothetical protein